MSGVLLGGARALAPASALSAYVLDFTASNWSSTTDAVTMSIPAATHGKETAFTVTVYMLQDDGSYTTSWGTYTDVYWEVKVSSTLDVTVTANTAFAGRIVLM